MKKSLVLLTTLGLTACHSLNMRALTKVEESSSLQLPQLEAVYESRVAQAGLARQCNSSVVKSNSPYARIFYREVEKNISDYYTPKAGYIKLNYVSTQTGSGNGWTFFSIIPPFVLNLFGMPMSSATYETEMEVRILDNDCNPVKIYRETAEETEYMAMWWGYGSPDYKTKASLSSYKVAFEKIKQKIAKDRDLIESRLTAKTEDKKEASASNNQPVTVVINNNIGTAKANIEAADKEKSVDNDVPNETAIGDKKAERTVKKPVKTKKSTTKSKKTASSKTNKTKK